MENEKDLIPVEMQKIYVCMFDSENLVSMDNHAVGFVEEDKFLNSDRQLASFKEVALIDPNFIAFQEIGVVLIFEDMELIILSNPKADMCKDCIVENGF